ncbi:hypothetical protein V1264_001461 [Littorina saxatilis]
MPQALLLAVLFCNVIIISEAALSSSSSSSNKEQFVFRDSRQEEFAKGLEDFIFTVPSRVTSQGDFVTNHLHAKHTIVKRHAAPSPLNIAKDTGGSDVSGRGSDVKIDTTFSGKDVTGEGTDVIHYRIPVHDGKDVIVRLRENSRLLSPGAVVETKTWRYRNASDSQFRTLQQRRGCHLAGTVLGDQTSRVALAACDGLSGFVHTGGKQYIIEPVKGHNPAEDPYHRHPHIVYKRSALPAPLNSVHNSAPDEPTCGVQDDFTRVLKRRERWERHRRHADRKTLQKEEEKAAEGGRRSKRKKRSISSEKNVETLVVVDPEMMKYYQNEDIENYVLTVMNMVAILFHDASIGNAVNIVIVRMLLLKDPDEELQITHHADKTLRSFCKWQKSVNFRDDDHPNHHDVALLLTRQNICNRMNQPCSTLGLAQVSGMCQPHRSCNINEDTGLSLAWTITHEIGHNFAMKHDSKHNDCSSPPGEMFVMAPHLSWDLIPARWSLCSRKSITNFLDRDWGYCLDDEPGHHDFKYPVLPAGTMYDADHQCRLLYGEDAALCGGIQDLENICSTLWCRVDNKCSTKLQPAAEGTICGTNRWCFAGKCVEIGERPESINGEWGQWGEWTSCSRTCGAGVSHSERHCNHPPPSNGGKYCLGERKRYRICNTDTCPDDGVSFRHVQCKEFANIPYKGKTYDWIPVPTRETPCQLHCKPKDMFFSVLLKDIVTDGTPCVHGGRHMCISGGCRHVGCDWEIDSSATEDRCGVCYGDGSTCTTVTQQFNETKEHGYVEATIIPQGARNIRVEEVASASNFLALANERGEYYLNGHWFIQWSGDYEMAGTVVHYDRLGNKESFKAQGPLKEPLKIMLLMQTHNPGVTFEYTVPNENATDTRVPEFRWDFTHWSHCTLSCGGGTQRSEVICLEKEAGRVDTTLCDQDSKPDDKLRACNDHLCPARWWTGPWQHCSVTCGEDGSHKRSVMCVRSLGEGEQIALEDAACGHLKKPKTVEPCKTKEPCPGTVPTWMTGNWTQCNGNPCAIQTRPAVCSDVTEGCDPFTRPVTSRPCSNITCGDWKTEEWSACTRTCGEGVQVRRVTCVGDTTCDLELEPPAKQTCSGDTCPEATDNNSTESETTATTFSSMEETHTTLLEKSNNNKSIVLNTGDDILLGLSDDSASENIVLGESTINLETSDAKNDVITVRDNDGSISLTNKQGSKEKSASDPQHKHRHHGKHSQNSNPQEKHGNRYHGNKPTTDQEKDDVKHSSDLKSKHNGTAQKEGYIENEHEKLHKKKNFEKHHKQGGEHEHHEKYHSKPKNKFRHSKAPDTLVLGETTPTVNPPVPAYNKQIKDGLQKVNKEEEEDVSDETTDDDEEDKRENDESDGEAEEQKGVDAGDEFEWYAGEWRKCSSECGDGVQTRAVSCFRKTTGQRVDAEFCSIHTKPSAIQECNTDPCVEWVASTWGECSATCGYAMRFRSVTCPDGGQCDRKYKPRDVEVCSSLSPCIAWVTGDWSKCSKTCGGGTQQRMVQCVNMTSEHASEACDGASRPSERQSCNVDDCPATDAAFTVNCESNEMSYKVCRMLKKVGLCHKDYVQAKCCRTCADHTRKSPANRIADLR